ncbi:MAG: HAD family hydrolase, partial [Pseudomonadota bacterium]
MADVVVFDIGNVLIEWQPERYYDRTIGEVRRRALFDEVDLHAVNDLVDRGADFRDTIYSAAEANPAWANEIRAWHDHWLELAQPVIPHSVLLLRQLRAKGVPVFALTNFGIGSFELAERHYSFLTEFDRRYISGHMRCIKPEPRIYEMVEADSGVAPG